MKAETGAGFERQAAGQPTEAARARAHAERLRERGRPEDINAANDLDARAYNTELLVDRIEQTDTFGAIARRNATFGLSDANEMRQIAELKNRDLVLSEQDQRELGSVSPVGYERRAEWGKDFGAPILGQLVPIIALMMLYRYLFKKLAWKERTVAAFGATVLTCTLIGGYGFADGGSPSFGKAFMIYIIPSIIILVAYFLLKGEPPKALSSR